MKYLSKRFFTFYLAFVCFYSVAAFSFGEEAEDISLSENTIKARSGNSIIDKLHDGFTGNIHKSALWFDRFFGEERTEEEGQPGIFIRWRSDFEWKEGGDVIYRRRIHANFTLPNATEKLRLVFTGEKENNLSDIHIDDTLDAGYEKEKLKFRYNFLDSITKRINIDVGAWTVKLRYRNEYEFYNDKLFRFTQSVFWDDSERFGETTRIDLERRIDDSSLLRWSTSGTYSETSEGLEWGSAVSYFCQISSRNALSFDLSVAGVTEPVSVVQNYRAAIRFRRNFYREWLFYEIEPEIDWPRDDDGNRDSVMAITFRLEVQFKKS